MKHRVYVRFFHLVLALAFLTGYALPQNETASDTKLAEKFEKSFDFFPGGKIYVSAFPSGNVTILGWDKSSVKVEAVKTIYGPPGTKFAPLMNNLTIRIRGDGVERLIATVSGLSKPLQPRIDYTMYVPSAKTDLNVVAGDGSVVVQGINGFIEVQTVQGHIQLTDLKGYASASARVGDVRVALMGPYWEGSQLVSSAYQGNVIVEIPKDYSANLYANAKKGEIHVNYPPQMVNGEEVTYTPVRKKKASSLECTLGSGGPPIRLYTNSGDIHIVVRNTQEENEKKRK